MLFFYFLMSFFVNKNMLGFILKTKKMLNILLTLNHNNDYMRYLEMEILNFAINDSIRRNIVPTWNILLSF
mgnify:CR=1 FL=1